MLSRNIIGVYIPIIRHRKIMVEDDEVMQIQLTVNRLRKEKRGMPHRFIIKWSGP